MAQDDQEYRIRMALAARAHDADLIRLDQRDLRGFDHVVASRQGLFAVRPGARSLIAHGQYYGITIDQEAIYVFEACGQPRLRDQRGRVLCLRHHGGRIVDAAVIIRGLDNGCHQIDLIDGRLCVTDTYNQRLLRISLDGAEIDLLYPLPLPDEETGAGYAHVNSVLASGDATYLLKHNNSAQSGLDSEIAVFDRAWRLTDTLSLAGQGCHNIAMLEDGTLIACGSLAGEILMSGGRSIKVCDRMTRGLSVDDAQVVVGGSVLLSRDMRDQALGAVYFLDRDYRQLNSVEIPGPVMEIRRIDGQDRSLSAHLGRG